MRLIDMLMRKNIRFERFLYEVLDGKLDRGEEGSLVAMINFIRASQNLWFYHMRTLQGNTTFLDIMNEIPEKHRDMFMPKLEIIRLH